MSIRSICHRSFTRFAVIGFIGGLLMKQGNVFWYFFDLLYSEYFPFGHRAVFLSQVHIKGSYSTTTYRIKSLLNNRVKFDICKTFFLSNLNSQSCTEKLFLFLQYLRAAFLCLLVLSLHLILKVPRTSFVIVSF